FDNNFFDFIICSYSFHHYFSPDKVLSEVQRVLKPGGRIYILDTTSDVLIVRIVDKRRRKKYPTHVKLYSSRDYKELYLRAKLNYIGSKSIRGLYTKVHIGEKPK